MRAVVQRVKQASIKVEGKVVSEIGPGLLVFLGVEKYDKESDADYLLKKIVELRIFSDADDKFNNCLADVGGEIMIISQFTICGDARRGRRPSFSDAEKGKQAAELYEYMVYMAKDMGLKVGEGRFGAHMEVSLVNDGPVTMLLDSGKLF